MPQGGALDDILYLSQEKLYLFNPFYLQFVITPLRMILKLYSAYYCDLVEDI